ncbi:hypothetical protein SAMN02799624_05558 [Paenibacillus sp. UNC496MF]|uniref:hypothetical protein n=1 Tax=Paenibacillus sp. UNC496MF TaxID=1502753 RepID=UPI0008F29B77|nr:hypothetical protein [Paenibacillus sp. UNC496MF]SFJ69913.1 hypothetical protein SAMN02799624_05558 [Paenibacillus sp. UNC496MF]
MKLLEAVRSNRIAGTLLASALVIGSLGAITAFAASGGDAIPKNTVMTASAPADAPAAADAAQGTIQYGKTVYSTTNGSQNFTMEHWYDPQTKDYRSDVQEYSADHRLLSYRSTYFLNGRSELVAIQRNQNGDPVGGKLLKRADDAKPFEPLDQKSLDFSAVKQTYQASYWTSVGTETKDGKTLNKLMNSYQSTLDDGTQANMQYIAYLDPQSGFPVKEELYEDSTGTYKLFSIDTEEYRYVPADDSIFNTGGVTLAPVKTSDEMYAK